MKATACTVLVLAAACGSARATSASPIAKVIELLSGLQSKIVADGKEAQRVYEEFAEYCEDRSRELGFEVKTGKAEEADLKASIDKATSTIGSLNAKIEELAADIATADSDLKAATLIRTKEAGDFAAEEKELMEVIDMLGRAIGILEREMQEGGASMLQTKTAGSIAQALSALVEASALSATDGAKLTALVQAAQSSQDDSADAGAGAPDAAAYEGHSGDIISTLEGLLEKAQAQLSSARKQETAAIHNFELLKQSLTDDMASNTKEMDKAKQGIAASSERKATAGGELDATSKALAADTASLADLHQDCMSKAQDFEAATKSRDEEVKAITEAKKVLAEQTGSAEKITYGFNQVASFVQLTSRADLAKFEAVRRIRDLARQQHSSALAQLASRAAAAIRASTEAGQDPFAKVKSLISDMVAKLEDEAESDASQKAYCDKELSETTAKKADKEFDIEKLSTKIEQMTTRSAKLKEEVASLQKSLSELASSSATMDKLREEENADYVKNKADMEQGLQGVKMALEILREYYAQASDAHTAAEGTGATIIGLLEVVESDLSKTLAGIVTTEESAQSEYDAETKEHEVERTSKEQDVKYKSKEAAGLDKAVADAATDRSAVQEELDSVTEYLGTLNKQCIAVPETYAERKARREVEITGLKAALTALDGEAVLLQREHHSRRTLRGQQALEA